MKIGLAQLMSRREGFRGIMTRGEGSRSVKQQADSVQVALRAFERDLPRLRAERPGQWVAYQGNRLLGFATQQRELYHDCFQKGLSRGGFNEMAAGGRICQNRRRTVE
jgi:hypothetical protein